MPRVSSKMGLARESIDNLLRVYRLSHAVETLFDGKTGECVVRICQGCPIYPVIVVRNNEEPCFDVGGFVSDEVRT